ncbi:MAG: phytase [Calditrichaeota bacterium]|nr:phytase [Calditrichota bacterium]
MKYRMKNIRLNIGKWLLLLGGAMSPAAAQIPACPPGVFGAARVNPAFSLNGNGKNIDTIAFWAGTAPGDTRMFVTAKDNALLEVWHYPFQGHEMAPLTHPTFHGSPVNGVVADQAANLLYVAIGAPASTVSVFTLPDLEFVRNFNKPGVDLEDEPNLALLTLPDGAKRLYVSSTERVYIHDAAGGELLGEFVPEAGLETMFADNFYQALYIPDENDRSGVYVYDPEGKPFLRDGTNRFGKGVFDSDAEGVWVYICYDAAGNDSGDGMIIVADQVKPTTEFECFDRRSWAHLGTVRIDGVGNTDGICSLQHPLPDYPLGLFVAIDDDTAVAGVGWEVLLERLRR